MLDMVCVGGTITGWDGIKGDAIGENGVAFILGENEEIVGENELVLILTERAGAIVLDKALAW